MTLAEPFTIAREQLIDVCHLNRPSLIDFRNYVLDLMDMLSHRPSSHAKRPPAGNTRPRGIATSYFEQRKRGELPEVY